MIDFRLLTETFVTGATRFLADEKVRIETLCLSPCVEEPLNSKVIKSFVPEHRSRYVFFEILCSMYICNERPMYISHIRVYGYGTICLSICMKRLLQWRRQRCLNAS